MFSILLVLIAFTGDEYRERRVAAEKAILNFAAWPGRDDEVRAGFKIDLAFLAHGKGPKIAPPDRGYWASDEPAPAFFSEWRVSYGGDSDIRLAVGLVGGSPLQAQEVLVRRSLRTSRDTDFAVSHEIGDVMLFERPAGVLLFCRDNIVVEIMSSMDPKYDEVLPRIARRIDAQIRKARKTSVDRLASFHPKLVGTVLPDGEIEAGKTMPLRFRWSDPNASVVEVRYATENDGRRASVEWSDEGFVIETWDSSPGEVEIRIEYATDHLLAGETSRVIRIVPRKSIPD